MVALGCGEAVPFRCVSLPPRVQAARPTALPAHWPRPRAHQAAAFCSASTGTTVPLQPLSQGLALRPPESQPTPALAWRSPSACGSQPAVGLRRILHVGSAGCSKVPYGGLSESCSCEKQRPRHALLLDDGAHTHGERHRTLTTNTTTTTTQTKPVYILCVYTRKSR